MKLRWEHKLPHLVAWGTALVAVLIVLLTTRYVVQEEWQETERFTHRELSNLSRLSQEHANRTLHAADQALRLVRTLYLRDGLALDSAALVQQGAVDVSVFHQVGIIDAQGIYRLSNLPATPAVDLSDRAHFKVHVGRATDELFISQPVLGRVSGKWTIQLTRRMAYPDGRFAGVAVVSVDADYFSAFYARLDLGAHGAAALVGRDGVVRARYQADTTPTAVAPVVTSLPTLSPQAQAQAQGFFEARSPQDQVLRLHHFRQLQDYPLYVMLALGVQDYRAQTPAAVAMEWLLAALGSILLLCLAALFSWHQVHEERQRRALQVSHEQMSLALDGGGLGLWEWDLAQGRFVADERLKGLLGFAPHEVETNEVSFMAHLHPDDVAKLRQVLPPVLRGEVPRLVLEHRLKHKDGHWVWLMARGQVVERDALGRALRLVGTDVDRSAQKLGEVEREIAAVAFESSSAMMVSDAQQVILRVNQAFVDLAGYTIDEMVGHSSDILKSGRHDGEFYRSMWNSINQTGHWQGEIWNRRKGGEVFLDWLSISVVKDVQGQVTHYVSVHADITLRKRTEEEIRKLAFFDPLTNLPNRRLLLDRLQQMCAARTRNQQLAAVLYVDLDRFKLLNDTHGHDQGDELLIQVAARLLACVREMDTVARLGGDEFVVALAQLGADPAQAQASALGVSQKILQTLSQPFVLSDVSWSLSGSIGVAMLVNPRCEPNAWLKQADEAMYSAKTAGRNTVRVVSATE